MTQRILIVCAALLAPALAFAQPQKTADDYYKDGETQYNLGNFQGAVDAFKKGFEIEPNDSKKAAYLYNVAQAYRQNKDCTNAQFFYKRYLALKDNDSKKPLNPEKRQEIEDRIKELDECAKQQESIRNKPPVQNLRPDGEEKPDGNGTGTGTGAGTGTGTGMGTAKPKAKEVAVVRPPDPGDDDEGITTTAPGPAPRLISARLTGGGAKVTAGDLPIPTLATAALIAGHPIAINDQLSIEVGAGFTYTRVPYEQTGTMQTKTANLIALMANVGVSYEVIPKLSIRGDLGVGGLFFTGVSESPFTGNQPTTGALTMAHVRVGLSRDYAITPNLLATITPIAFSYSPPKQGLRDDIKSITAIDFMIGLGYRM